MKYTPEIVEQLIDLASRGATNRDAARIVGIGERTLYRWLNEKAELADNYTRAQSQANQQSIELIAASDDWRAHAWLAERRDPANWAKPEKRIVEDPSELFAAFLEGRRDATVPV